MRMPFTLPSPQLARRRHQQAWAPQEGSLSRGSRSQSSWWARPRATGARGARWRAGCCEGKQSKSMTVHFNYHTVPREDDEERGKQKTDEDTKAREKQRRAARKHYSLLGIRDGGPNCVLRRLAGLAQRIVPRIEIFPILNIQCADQRGFITQWRYRTMGPKMEYIPSASSSTHSCASGACHRGGRASAPPP